MTEIEPFRALSHRSVVRCGKRFGLGATGRRRRDKSGSPVAIQAIGMACLSPCRSVGSRAAPEEFGNVIKGLFGTHGQISATGGLI